MKLSPAATSAVSITFSENVMSGAFSQTSVRRLYAALLPMLRNTNDIVAVSPGRRFASLHST